jgi:hypothetical protein
LPGGVAREVGLIFLVLRAPRKYVLSVIQYEAFWAKYIKKWSVLNIVYHFCHYGGFHYLSVFCNKLLVFIHPSMSFTLHLHFVCAFPSCLYGVNKKSSNVRDWSLQQFQSNYRNMFDYF